MATNDLDKIFVIEDCQKITVQEVVIQAKKETLRALLEGALEIGGSKIGFSSSDTHFKGKRLWFICPKCGTRRGALYREPLSDSVLCRKCLGIKYSRQVRR